MKAKDVIKGIEEGFDDNEQIADAVEWVSDAASSLAEFEQDNHMQSIEIEKLKAENERLKAAAQAVVDAESAINNAIIALSADAWNEIVEQRKRTLVQAIYALRQQIREQTK